MKHEIDRHHAASAPDQTDELVALVLQGGGALGAYQAGAYDTMHERGVEPGWLAGISIGAINAAIIAGNAPEVRVAKLRAFWDGLSSSLQGSQTIPGEGGRSAFNEASAWFATMLGIDGFFRPRFLPPQFQPPGSDGAVSYYDTTPLQQTLESLVDFDLLNERGPRLSVGAVHIKSGNFVYFDSRKKKIGPEHIMASAALPPGFPPVVIEGEAYWDGGIVSNTPLQYVLDKYPHCSNLSILQVDLFSASGAVPKTIFEVTEREKEIRYSSRTRLNTDAARKQMQLRNAASRLAKRLPAEFANDPDLKLLTQNDSDTAIALFHLIHRPTAYDTQSKDYEFSRLSMVEHWDAGKADALKTLLNSAWHSRTAPHDGIAVFDLAALKI